MAMGVILRSDGNGPDSAVNYSLQAREIQINLSRSPMQSRLPGGDPLLLDLGQIRPVIKITGIVRSTPGADGGLVIPSKRQLEDYAEEDLLNYLIVILSNKVNLYFENREAYNKMVDN